MLQVVQQLQQHSACVAEQLQRLASMWPAAAAPAEPAAEAGAGSAGVQGSALPYAVQQRLQACLQQQQVLELQLLSLQQLVQSAIAAAMLHLNTTQCGSSAAVDSSSGSNSAAASSLAATGSKLREEHALCFELLDSLSDAVGQLTVEVAAAAPAAADASAAAAVVVTNSTHDVSDSDGAAVQEGREQCIGAVSEVLSAAVQHLLSAMQLVGFEGE
jgi:hypothetical protein